MESNATDRLTQAGTADVQTPLSDIFFMTLRQWPWIVVSLAVCLGAAVFYILRTPSTYTRSAQILVKEDSKGKSLDMGDFADFGLFQSKTNIYNEVSTIVSPDLMREVVSRLNLDVNYLRDGTFHKNVAYGYDLPVTVGFVDSPDENGVSLRLELEPGDKARISELKYGDGRESDKTWEVAFGDTIDTPAGKLTVVRSGYYEVIGDKASETFSVVKTPLSQAVESYNKRLKVEMSEEKGTVLRLSFTDQSVQRADDVLNTLINVYNESWIRDKNQIAVSTSNFINDRLGVIEGELGNVDSDISAYKSEHLIPDVQAASSLYMAENQTTAKQVLALGNQLQMARYVRSYLTNESSRNSLLPANSGIENGEIQALIAEYNERLLQRNSLAAKSSDKNPLVITLDRKSVV